MPAPSIGLLVLSAMSAHAATADGDTLPERLQPARQEPAPESGGESVDAESPKTPDPRGRTYLMQANVRARYLTVPQSILDIWYFDSDDPGANPYKRPKVHAWTVGGEYVLQMDPGHWIFYAEYAKSMMDEGYFDDVEEPADHDDGDWVRPDGLGVVAFGFDYMHEVVAVPTGPDHGAVGLSFLFGAGLGMGIMTGGIEEWHPGSNPDNTDTSCRPLSPAYDRVDACPSDGYKRLPGVVPMVDLIAAMRLNFSDHAHIRFEGGVHDMLFFGTSVGAVF
ncbi:MAG: hypothetical protein H6742_07405 [Alphaproteobacteria bacterium]|nr:hypothetical protein [Alphaproteobacteria bacterium]